MEEIKKINDEALLISIIKAMTIKYTLTETKLSLSNYKKTHNITTITRENDLRNKVKLSQTFNNYIDNLTKEQLYTLIDKNKSIDLKKILEEVSKQTYITAKEKGYDAKKQLAIGLIKISYGDYTSITRMDNAREMAENNIKPEKIDKIIKESLKEKNISYDNDKQMYLNYVDYIEYLYSN